MLNRKQLEDAARCEENKMKCKECSCHVDSVLYCVATKDAAQTAIALADMLKETTEALDGAVKILRRYNLDTYIEKSHVVVKAQALLKEMEGDK